MVEQKGWEASRVEPFGEDAYGEDLVIRKADGFGVSFGKVVETFNEEL